MKYLIFSIFLISLSCNKEKYCCDARSTGIGIFVVDSLGNDLLNTEIPGAINTNEIELMYLIDGSMQTVYNPNMDCPRNVCYYNEHPEGGFIRIFPNEVESEEYPITYIDWGNGDIDTLKCHFIRNDDGRSSSIVCDKVWFNNILEFPDNAIHGFDRTFKIVK